MNEVVLDASVVLKWFHSEGEGHLEDARKLRAQFEAGELRVLAPQLLWLELLNVAARRWGWPQPKLEQLAVTLEQLGFELLEPELLSVAKWAANGLTAYDAAYLAVAERAGTQVITNDEQILATAPTFATALGGPARELHGGRRQLAGEQLGDWQQHTLGVVLLPGPRPHAGE